MHVSVFYVGMYVYVLSVILIFDPGCDLIAIVGDITPSDGVPKEEKSRRERAALNEMCEVLGGGARGRRS